MNPESGIPVCKHGQLARKCEICGWAPLRRKALELTGWKIQVEWDGAMLGQNPANQAWGFAPAVECDPAASEPWFLEWCAKNEYEWRLWSADNQYLCWLTFSDTMQQAICAVMGATPSIARALAVIAASEKQ